MQETELESIQLKPCWMFSPFVMKLEQSMASTLLWLVISNMAERCIPWQGISKSMISYQLSKGLILLVELEFFRPVLMLCCICRLLTLYKVNLRYISPKGLEMPDSVVQYVASKGISQVGFFPLCPFLLQCIMDYSDRQKIISDHL